MPSRQDMGQKEPLQPPSLRSGFSNLYRQSLVAAESAGKLEFRELCVAGTCGTDVLLVVDTEKADEVTVLEEKVKTDLGGTGSYKVLRAPGGKTEQVYDEQGFKVLAERTESMVDFVDRNRELIPTETIGTIVIGAIQSYIRMSTREGSGAAFEMVALYNTKTKKAIHGVSKGVPLQAEYLSEAREGRTTYGEALLPDFYGAARRKFGCGFDLANDWCWAVCGQSRYDRLQAVARDLGSIFRGACT